WTPKKTAGKEATPSSGRREPTSEQAAIEARKTVVNTPCSNAGREGSLIANRGSGRTHATAPAARPSFPQVELRSRCGGRVLIPHPSSSGWSSPAAVRSAPRFAWQDRRQDQPRTPPEECRRSRRKTEPGA